MVDHSTSDLYGSGVPIIMRYKLAFNFESDRPLTDKELDHLADACLAQVEDPSDYTGKTKRASFTVLGITYSYGKIGK
jgi:hypothetical protein